MFVYIINNILQKRGGFIMFIDLQDDHFTINGYVAACHCKCTHCLLCSGDNKIAKIDKDIEVF